MSEKLASPLTQYQANNEQAPSTRLPHSRVAPSLLGYENVQLLPQYEWGATLVIFRTASTRNKFCYDRSAMGIILDTR